jgi:Kef-type K+ transport system membrane component KefB
MVCSSDRTVVLCCAPQDIAVVPFLVLLPLIESNGGMEGASADTLLQMLGPTTLTSLAGLGALLVGGRVVLRRVFEVRRCDRSEKTGMARCSAPGFGA